MAPRAASLSIRLPPFPLPPFPTSFPFFVPLFPLRRLRYSTASMVVCASCVENAQNLQLASLLAGSLARAAAVFSIDEVVVLDDVPGRPAGGVSRAAALLARVLQYLETPQYLRRALVPMHADLRFAGSLPPLDAPHHLRATEWGLFREGVVRASGAGAGSAVDVGLERDAWIADEVPAGARVTLRMRQSPQSEQTLLRGEGGAAPAVDVLAQLSPAVGGVVGQAPDGSEVYLADLGSPLEPRAAHGAYWGYSVRVASGFKQAIGGSPFGEPYDLIIGTSERGSPAPPGGRSFPPFKHALVVFGGPLGLERALTADPDPPAEAQGDVANLFQHWINTCPHQGSRTIRTEEAVLISLAHLDPAVGF